MALDINHLTIAQLDTLTIAQLDAMLVDQASDCVTLEALSLPPKLFDLYRQIVALNCSDYNTLAAALPPRLAALHYMLSV